MTHWHYKVFRVELGDGLNGTSTLQFVQGVDGRISRIVLDENAVYSFAKVVVPSSGRSRRMCGFHSQSTGHLMRALTIAGLLLTMCKSCTNQASEKPAEQTTDPLPAINATLDSYHEAASKADGQERNRSLDIIRGVAIFGLIWVNGQGWSTTLTSADRVSSWIMFVFAAGKFWTLFSILFGLTLAMQIERADGFTGRWLRRMAVLFAIGWANAIFFWPGDILREYAMAGAVLLLFRRGRTTWGACCGLAGAGVERKSPGVVEGPRTNAWPTGRSGVHDPGPSGRDHERGGQAARHCQFRR